MATSDPRFSTNPTNSVEGGSFQRPSEGEGIVASENTGPLSQPVNPNASVPSDPKGGQFERLRQRGEYLESGGHFETPILPDPVFYYLESVIFPLLEEEDAVSTSILVGGLLIGEPYPSESLLPGGTIVSGELKNIVQNQNYDPTLEGIIPGGIVVSGTLITVVVNTSYDPTLEGIIPGGTVVSGVLT